MLFNLGRYLCKVFCHYRMGEPLVLMICSRVPRSLSQMRDILIDTLIDQHNTAYSHTLIHGR